MAALFAASPPVLLAASAMSPRNGGDTLERLLRLAMLLVTCALWVDSIVRFCHFQETVRTINAAISARISPTP